MKGRERVNQVVGPPRQGSQAPSVLLGLGVHREKGNREEENKFLRARKSGPKLPGSKGLFRKEGGVKKGGVGWGRDG